MNAGASATAASCFPYSTAASATFNSAAASSAASSVVPASASASAASSLTAFLNFCFLDRMGVQVVSECDVNIASFSPFSLLSSLG
jgi:hypothetical protein